MTRDELLTLLGMGVSLTLRKDGEGRALSGQAAPREESAALDALVDSLFEYGDVLFDPDGPNGPSLTINNEIGTEISLTEGQAKALMAVGVPTFPEVEPSFDDLLQASSDDARILMEEIRDAGEEERFMEALRQLAPLLPSAKGGAK